MFALGLSARLRALFSRLRVDTGKVSRSTPAVEVAQAWNNPNEVFVGKDNNITDTASNASSILERWSVNGVEKVAILKSGDILTTTIGAAYSGSAREMSLMNYSYFGLNFACNTQSQVFFDAWYLRLKQPVVLSWGPGQANSTQDTGLARNSAGVVEINNATAGTYRDLKLRNLIGTGNLATGTVSKTANYTATANDGTIEVDATSGAVTITLPAVSGTAGRIYVIKKVDSSANAVTVDPNASETIDGATTVSLASQYSTIIIQANAAGTAWHKLASV